MGILDTIKYKLKYGFRCLQMGIENFFQPFWDRKHPQYFWYQDFCDDEQCTKITFDEEQNIEKTNLYQIKVTSKLTPFIVTNISANVYYRGITFRGVTFKGVNLKHVCFHNCTFHFCKFIDVTTDKVEPLSISTSYKQVFNFCDFYGCKFTDCNFEDTVWSVGTLKGVVFENTKLYCSMFQRISFSQVQFVGNCELYRTSVLSPSAQFDIEFYEKEGHVKIDLHSRMSPFDYHDKINIGGDADSRERYRIFKKSHYEKIAATYYAFEQLCASSYVLPRYENYYYERKRAETRSKSLLKSIPGYLSEIVIGYGESPVKALGSMGILISIFSFIYMLTGFNNGLEINAHDVNYYFDLGQLFVLSKDKIIDWLHSLYFSFFTLITIGQGNAYPTSSLTQLFMAIEFLLGAVLVTLFTATLFRKYTK